MLKLGTLIKVQASWLPQYPLDYLRELSLVRNSLPNCFDIRLRLYRRPIVLFDFLNLNCTFRFLKPRLEVNAGKKEKASIS